MIARIYKRLSQAWYDHRVRKAMARMGGDEGSWFV